LKIPSLILGIVIILGGMGIAIYGTRLPSQYSYQGIISDKTQTYTPTIIQMGNFTSFSENVSSGSWMEINIFSDNGDFVEMDVMGSVSGQLYNQTSDSFLEMIKFSKNETVSVKILNTSLYPTTSYGGVAISGTITFEHYGIVSATRYQVEPLYLVLGGVFIIIGIVLLIYSVRSNKTKKFMTSSFNNKSGEIRTFKVEYQM
jgi:uncharacterized membrane protein YidH (DUF202 family)